MITARFDGSFEGWRSHARMLLLGDVAPHEVNWASEDESAGLFDDSLPHQPIEPTRLVTVPKLLLSELEQAARYRIENRWALLYRVLWRVSRGDTTARLVGDIDGSELHSRIKAVRREAHHLHAFLRFSPAGREEGPSHVAWFEPAHDILPWAAEHFAERMGENSWLIATPDDGVCWDGRQLYYTRPCPPAWRQLALEVEDPEGSLWKTYYENTFNPSRLNRSVMESNLPVRFWKNLPEGALILQLMSRARAGAQSDGQSEQVASKAGKRIGRTPERTG